MALSDTALVTLLQAKAHLRIDAVSSLHKDAEYVGVGDGEVDFPLPSGKTPISGSLVLKVDNTLQVEDTDFTFAADVITFATAPSSGDIITASYDYAADADTFESFDDDLLENLIEAATKKAEDYTGRAFILREITETHIGDNKQVLRLYKQPVVSISSVSVGGDTLTTYTERLSIGRLYHPVVWPLDYEVIVKYVAGYAATVPDAVAAVLLIIANLYENRTDQVKSESIAGIGSVTYDIPSQAKEWLNPLRVNLL